MLIDICKEGLEVFWGMLSSQALWSYRSVGCARFPANALFLNATLNPLHHTPS